MAANIVSIDELCERSGEDIMFWYEMNFKKKAEVIRNLKVGERVVIMNNTETHNRNNIRPFYNYIEGLKDEGDLEIGKGGCEYGFSMPLPEKEGDGRELIFYRRR